MNFVCAYQSFEKILKMVYDKSDRWLYRPLSYKIERLCNRSICNRSSETESKLRPVITKLPADVQSVSISHRSDGVSKKINAKVSP